MHFIHLLINKQYWGFSQYVIQRLFKHKHPQYIPINSNIYTHTTEIFISKPFNVKKHG